MDTVSGLFRICICLCILYGYNGVEGRKLRRVRRGWFNSGGKPAGVQCAFNPCSVPGFCGEGRTCEMDNNCIHECVCDEDSKHEKCTNTGLVTTTPKQVNCAFNPCSSPSFACEEGMQCVLGEFCRPKCQCIDNETHPLCSGKTTDPTDTTDTDLDTYVCVAGESSCLHGTCMQQTHGFICVCQKGWQGKACNISQCTKECPEDSFCHFVTSEVQICLSQNKPDLADENDNKIHDDVCDADYEIRTKQEQNCVSDIECKHGVCESINGIETCVCDKGASGTACEYKCCKDCGDLGTCEYVEGIGETCICSNNQTGDNCTMYGYDFLNETVQHIQPEDPTWHYWVVGSCAFVLLLLICLMVVIPYFLWKHRVILVMKVVHYFQEYEDDDDREWDVFISYKSTEQDESFVVDTLFPKLEKELGFKAHVHFRDFMAGETISNNIISAVQGSRRTIMVISPSYVTSEFTKFEYQVAQQEMLKRKHRIIPILLEDISECKETMDPTLKIILGSVTYIEWPKTDAEKKKMDKFWKRIELSMPKKKNRKTDTESPVFNNINNINATTNPAIKPSDIPAKISNDKTTSKYTPTDANVYSSIDESKLNKEEVYDALNETEMLTQVLKRQGQQQPEKMTNEEKLAHVLKVDV